MSKVVQKGNKQLTINDDKINDYLEIGFSEVNEKGKIVQAGKATTLKDVQAENNTLKAELSKVNAENEKLKAELESLKVDKKTK